jgi:hypothetical protein
MKINREGRFQTTEKKGFIPAVRDRQERIQELFNDIKNNPNEPLDRIMGKYGVRTGLTDHKIREYLEVLEKAGQLKIDWTNNKAEPA